MFNKCNKTQVKMKTRQSVNISKTQNDNKPSISLKAQLYLGFVFAFYFVARVVISLF